MLCTFFVFLGIKILNARYFTTVAQNVLKRKKGSGETLGEGASCDYPDADAKQACRDWTLSIGLVLLTRPSSNFPAAWNILHRRWHPLPPHFLARPPER